MSTDVVAQAVRALDPLRSGLQEDGVRLVVSHVGVDALVVVDLLVEEDACVECLVSFEVIALMVESAITEAVPGVRGVELRDRRRGAPPAG